MESIHTINIPDGTSYNIRLNEDGTLPLMDIELYNMLLKQNPLIQTELLGSGVRPIIYDGKVVSNLGDGFSPQPATVADSSSDTRSGTLTKTDGGVTGFIAPPYFAKRFNNDGDSKRRLIYSGEIHPELVLLKMAPDVERESRLRGNRSVAVNAHERDTRKYDSVFDETQENRRVSFSSITTNRGLGGVYKHPNSNIYTIPANRQFNIGDSHYRDSVRDFSHISNFYTNYMEYIILRNNTAKNKKIVVKAHLLRISTSTIIEKTVNLYGNSNFTDVYGDIWIPLAPEQYVNNTDSGVIGVDLSRAYASDGVDGIFYRADDYRVLMIEIPGYAD